MRTWKYSGDLILLTTALAACSAGDGDWTTIQAGDRPEPPAVAPQSPDVELDPTFHVLSDSHRLELTRKLEQLRQPSTSNSTDNAEPSHDPAPLELEEGSTSEVAEAPEASEPMAPPSDTPLDPLLDEISETPSGGFVAGDIYLANEDELLDYLLLASDPERIDKGLVVTSHKWPREGCSPFCLDPPNLSVCWTADSGALAPEKLRAADLVRRTWGSVADTEFDFDDANGDPNSCASPGTWDIKIFQDSAINRGCAKIGTDHSTATEIDCGSGNAHASATMVLPSVPGGSNFVDYTVVHEFGHAIGLLHEQIRLEYNWGDPADPNFPPPASAPRNCSSADENITFLDGLVDARVTPTVYEDQNNATVATVGAFDDNSIMYYCQQQESLNNGFTDPRAKQISLGDIASSRALYDPRQYEAKFEYASWYPTSIDLSLDLLTSAPEEWTVTSGQTPQVLSTGLNAFAGDDYEASTTSVSDQRLTCHTHRPQAELVWGRPSIVPLEGFDSSPIRTTCYDVAAMSAFL